jgi:hypothetical protein
MTAIRQWVGTQYLFNLTYDIFKKDITPIVAQHSKLWAIECEQLRQIKLTLIQLLVTVLCV